MKFSQPNEWTRRFALFPVLLTHGAWDRGKTVCLETYYYKVANGEKQRISRQDHKYNQEMLFSIKSDPNRFGTDPWRKDY